ncbi:MAG: chloride channel protein [Prevotella sp.]|nr:chloride channel protein [Prevotella sp.]MBQ9669935.1 chloride channel protein [Prevotella sp.]MDY6229627.1 chloride channel protein [Prevotella sp.]
MNKPTSRLEQFIAWREQHVSDRQFTLLLSFAVGFFAAVAGFTLHWLIEKIEWLLTSRFSETSINWLYLVFPVVGIYLTSLFVKYIVKDNISHGITRILYAISTKRSRLKKHNTWTSVIASALTIGFGGSVGAEAPIVLTGSAIGSTLGQVFRMNNRTLMLLVGCGASAAIAGVFKAPIAGLVFTIEVLMIDLTMASLLPILIASVTATCFTYLFVGTNSLFDFHLDSAWTIERVLPSIMLGIACGLLSFYFIRMMTFCENGFAKLKDHRYAKLLIGGLVLSTLIFLFPSLYGEGYNSINILLSGSSEADWEELLNNSLFYGNNNLLILYIALVLFTKVFATSATNGGGGCGGTFAPSLFIGAFCGFLFARLWNIYDIGGVYVPEKNFALLGMAGVMAGVMHAPLTGIFLIAELTGGYQLFIPLIIVSVCSYLTIYIFEPHSIYGMRLARQGKLITHNTDRSILRLMSVETLIDKDFIAVPPDMPLAKLVNKISNSPTSLLPVVDNGEHLLGEVNFNNIRHIVFRTELYHHFNAAQLMSQPPTMLGDNDKMEEVMRKFEETNAEQLPVVTTDRRLLGYIDRTHMYTTYRQLVADYSTE